MLTSQSSPQMDALGRIKIQTPHTCIREAGSQEVAGLGQESQPWVPGKTSGGKFMDSQGAIELGWDIILPCFSLTSTYSMAFPSVMNL